MIILDASVLIAHLDATDAFHAQAEDLLRRHRDSSLGASPITMAETLVGPARAGRLDAALKAIDRLGVETITLPEDAPSRLATLRARTSLKLPDCCVLLAARPTDANPPERASIATFDDHLRTAASAMKIQVA